LPKAMRTETELQRQQERFEPLLNLTTRITPNLDLREVFRAIAANIRCRLLKIQRVTVLQLWQGPCTHRCCEQKKECEDFHYRNLQSLVFQGQLWLRGPS
jgi:hypothetical protein